MTDPNAIPPVELTKRFEPVDHPVADAQPTAWLPAVPPAVATQVTVVQQSNVEIILAWIFTVLTGLYMLPWAIAATRRTSNSVVVALLTFFLGWTIIGWLVCLIVSFTGRPAYSPVTTTFVTALPPAGQWAWCQGDPGNVRRWWDGTSWTPHTIVV